MTVELALILPILVVLVLALDVRIDVVDEGLILQGLVVDCSVGDFVRILDL